MLAIMIYVTSVVFAILILLLVIYTLASPFGRLLPSFFERIGRIIAVGNLVCFAVLSSLATILFSSTHGVNLVGTKVSSPNLITMFLGSSVLWALIFHCVAYCYGPLFTRIFTHNWVKSIDYVYLTLSIVSLLVAVMSMSAMEADNNFKAYFTVALSIAVALRLTKTTIEICSWDKPRRIPTSDNRFSPTLAGRCGIPAGASSSSNKPLGYDFVADLVAQVVLPGAR
jgi:hypothetical protein